MSARVIAKVDAVEVRRVPDQSPDLSYLSDGERYADSPPAERAKYEAADRDRLAAYERGEWACVGVVAVAKVRFYLSTHPDGSAGGFEVSTPGIWGVEDDSDESYFATLEGEERGELVDLLAALGLRIDGELSDAEALNALSAGVLAGTGSGADHAAALYEALTKTGRRVECECDEGPDAPIPGVLYPMASNSDNRVPWIERCDLCERFEGDEEAAKALVDEGIIPGYRMARPTGVESLHPFAVDADGKALPWPDETRGVAA